MCQPREIPRYTGMSGCTCGCCGCGCGPSFRSFFSVKEDSKRFESYRDQLKKEMAGVEECIKVLKNK
jgi:hypothetical protein